MCAGLLPAGSRVSRSWGQCAPRAKPVRSVMGAFPAMLLRSLPPAWQKRLAKKAGSDEPALCRAVQLQILNKSHIREAEYIRAGEDDMVNQPHVDRS